MRRRQQKRHEAFKIQYGMQVTLKLESSGIVLSKLKAEIGEVRAKAFFSTEEGRKQWKEIVSSLDNRSA